MATVDASRQALIQRNKNFKEQERSVDRTYAEMMKLRESELKEMDAREREDNKQRIEQLKEY